MSDSFAFNMIYRLILKIYKSTLFVLAFGFCIGFILGILFIQAHKKSPSHLNKTVTKNSTKTAETVYHSWLYSKGYNRQCLSSDQVSYGNLTFDTESTFLKKEINILCVIFVKKAKKVETILQTWGNHCNKIVFYGILDIYETDIPIYVIKPKSSWHYLCSAIRNIWLEHSANLQWILFAPDDIFALPENLRLVVSSLEPSVPHYLGHALMLWGESYNVAQAGYVLSRAALAAVAHRFNSTDACEKSGKHWKNEDYYLGKYLGEMGVYPTDTRDHLGRGRFHGFNFNQLLFSRKLSPLNSYWKRSIYPVTEGRECCSDTSITFHGVEEDKVHQFYYLLYRLKAFSSGGHLGNRAAPTPVPEDEVWRHFLRDEGLMDDPYLDVSPEQFYELSQRKIMPPRLFNEAIRQEAGG